eukprot:TRINITY_DN18194_c0_g1_i6.p1 TRINITY_DN18194_c0_g1~~TRINITY_DN18194_c0_g1_i6.p1  ORF type:complete len:347 (-),score=54.72 TRINITY_DN18194_c0_g1_i6:40-990(-)
MRVSVLKLRTRADGVTVGLLLSLLYFGNLIHQCGDVERNPGPGPKEGLLRQTRLSSAGGTSRRDSSDKADKTRAAPGSTPETSGQPSDPTLKDVVTLLNSMNCKFDSRFDAMDTKFDKLCEDVKEMKDAYASQQAEITNLKDDVSFLNLENTALKSENSALNDKVESLESKVDNLEGHSKRNNIIIHGIPRSEKETWQDCEDLVQEMITDKLEFHDNVQFDRVHRVSSKPNSPIVARCTFFKDKDRMLRSKQKLKGSNIFVGEDFSVRVREIRKKLVPHFKSARNQNKKVSMVYDHLVVEGQKYGLDGDDNLIQLT